MHTFIDIRAMFGTMLHVGCCGAFATKEQMPSGRATQKWRGVLAIPYIFGRGRQKSIKNEVVFFGSFFLDQQKK